VCKRYDILVVIDEIVTGFGRLGTMFGAQLYDIQPDIMVLSKQLISSYQPLAAVVVSDAINDVLVSQSQRLGAFAHGLTCTGHPVATAVALETSASSKSATWLAMCSTWPLCSSATCARSKTTRWWATSEASG